jgi:hypothetical protein
MRSRWSIAVLALIVALVSPAAASARAAKFSAKYVGKGFTNGAVQQDGTASFSPFGKGTTHSSAVPHQDGSTKYFIATVSFKLPGGTITLKGRIDGSDDPGNPALYSVNGHMRVISGTGKFKGKHGKFKVTGKGHNDLTSSTLKGTGSIS